MREFLNIAEKQNDKFNIFQIFCVTATIVLVLTLSGTAYAAIRYNNKIEEVPGFRFKNLVYAWNKVELDVVNTTSDNRFFGGKMIFLDRRGKPLASASLLPKKVIGRKSERYTAYFVEGSGEAAQRAASVIWDFGTGTR